MKSLCCLSQNRPSIRVTVAGALLVLQGFVGLAAEAEARSTIPDRPEKLSFPPLQYQPPRAADVRVRLKAGPVAYVIPDRELPLVNVVVYVRAGGYLTPRGKEGLEDLAGYLLARGGTIDRKADDLEERLDFLAARLNSAFGDTHGTVSLNLLSKDLPEGLGLLREVLCQPRFQEDKLALRKQQLLQEMQQRNDESAAIESRERRYLAYGEDFWANQLPTAASVQGISQSDLQGFHRRWIHPANFVVAASGDFVREEMIRKLETLFSDWPFSGDRSPSIPTNTVFAAPGTYLVNKEVNQGRASILLPGIQRDNPDFFPVTVMNDILGGGGFTSRIVNRVRSDEGLAYSAGSHFPGGTYFPATFTAMFQSKSRTVAYAASILLEEMARLSGTAPSKEELVTSKQSFIESFPRNFSTKARTASVFAEDELTGRFAKDPEYWQTYRQKIQAVTADDVKRVAERYLQPEKLVVLVVGQKEEILRGHPDHPVTLQSLTQGKLIDRPLRDPLTMRPMSDSARQ